MGCKAMCKYKIIPSLKITDAKSRFMARLRRDMSKRVSLKYVDAKEYLRFSSGITSSNDHPIGKQENISPIFPDGAIRPLERRLRSTRYHSAGSFGNRRPLLEAQSNGRNQAGEPNFYLSSGIVLGRNDCARSEDTGRGNLLFCWQRLVRGDFSHIY